MDDEQQQMIADCFAREGRLGDWERKFLDDIECRGQPLTERQDAKLTEIWERVT